MSRLVVHSKVGPDGVLRLNVPVGAVQADREMQITIEPAAPSNETSRDHSSWLDSIAGHWQGDLERMPSAGYESRDIL